MPRKTAGKTKKSKPAKAKSAVKPVDSPIPGRIGKAVELENVRRLVQMMVDNDLNELTVVEGQTRVELKRGLAMTTSASVGVPVAAGPVAVGGPAALAPAAGAPAGAAEKLLDVTSPMVGTFYNSPSPDSPPFIKVGAKINGDSVVCIVEAMKVMNEIKAECSGVVTEVCVENAQPVEYGQVLFRVRP